jgi:hypothetical protein
VPLLTYYGEREEVDRASAAGSFGQGRSGWSRTLIIDCAGRPETDLYETILDIVGTTRTPVSAGAAAGKLTRLLPKADPQFRWMVADSISSLQGLGQSGEITLVGTDQLEVPPVDDSYGLWGTYDARVNFVPAPYALLSDDRITVYDGDWRERGDPALRAFKFADEWLRFTLMKRAPRDEYVTAVQGKFKFFTGGAPGAGSAEGQTAKGQIRQYLNNADVTLTWHAIPLRYVRSDNCYFDKYRGRINQNEWETPWYRWAPGELLYQNYSYEEFVPAVATMELDPIFGTITSTEKLCNVVLKFLETKRNTTDTFVPADKNIIVGGHNLLPWHGDRKFHFGGTPKAGGGDPVPGFDSVDLRILFTDPDAFPAQPI